jgi:hypothetical protein
VCVCVCVSVCVCVCVCLCVCVCVCDTPQLPVPAYSALPHEKGCEAEGALLCADGRISGRQVRV